MCVFVCVSLISTIGIARTTRWTNKEASDRIPQCRNPFEIEVPPKQTRLCVCVCVCVCVFVFSIVRANRLAT